MYHVSKELCGVPASSVNSGVIDDNGDVSDDNTGMGKVSPHSLVMVPNNDKIEDGTKTEEINWDKLPPYPFPTFWVSDPPTIWSSNMPTTPE